MTKAPSLAPYPEAVAGSCHHPVATACFLSEVLPAPFGNACSLTIPVSAVNALVPVTCLSDTFSRLCSFSLSRYS
jgi:hypothetical protein